MEFINLKDFNIDLHLVRHGNYIPTYVGGWSSDHLSEEGIKEVNILKDNIDNDYDLFMASDLERAIDTANILNQKLNMNIVFNSDFREIDSGILNTTTVEDYNKNYKKKYGNATPDDIIYAGESQLSFFKRIQKAFMDLLENNKNKKILLVTHGGVISIILYLLNVKIADIKTGSITKLN